MVLFVYNMFKTKFGIFSSLNLRTEGKADWRTAFVSESENKCKEDPRSENVDNLHCSSVGREVVRHGEQVFSCHQNTLVSAFADLLTFAVGWTS